MQETKASQILFLYFRICWMCLGVRAFAVTRQEYEMGLLLALGRVRVF